MANLDQFAANYREEAAERLTELEATLLELEVDSSDAELVDRAFRALHTIKGSGAMFGFDDIASFTHELETVFDQVRNGKIQATKELVGLALEAKDLIRAMLDGAAQASLPDRERLVNEFRRLLPRAKAPQAAPASPAPSPTATEPPPSPDALKTYKVHFKPHPEIFLDGTNPLGLLDELRALGQCEIIAQVQEIPPLEELVPESCYVAWEATLTTDKEMNAIRDVFIFVEDHCELRIEPIGPPSDAASAGASTGLTTESVGSDARAEPCAATTSSPSAPSAIIPSPPAPELKGASVERNKRAGAQRTESSSSSIRVAAEKLDELVDLVGELVIAQARLTRISSRRDDPELLSISEEIDRLSSSLRDSTLSVRMVPIGTTFSHFKRLTHDLAAELGKEIELVTEGAETDLDKTVIERLGDPLVHLIRNSCDHGIEPPEARRAAGKPTRATVRLSAYHSGANVFIEIQDDGAGLDTAAIRAKALERGIIEADAKLSEKELFNLIFLPGFSTAAKVSNLSGRGVGMDVVKRSIEALRGTVTIDSTHGVSTTVRIKLPLTLAIIEGLLVSVGEAHYVLPLSIVEECVELTDEDVARLHGAKQAVVRGELVPYLRLREIFDISGARPPIEQIAIVNVEGNRYGLAVDEVIGQHQTVIKTLGRMHRNVKDLSGATILGDGTVALIVDVPALIQGALAAAAPPCAAPSTPS